MDKQPDTLALRGGSKYLAARTAAEERAAAAEQARLDREAEAQRQRDFAATQNGLNRDNARAIAGAAQGERRAAAEAKTEAAKKDADTKLNLVRRGASETLDALEELATFNDDGTVTLKPGVGNLYGLRMPGASLVPGSDAANAAAARDRLLGRLVVDPLPAAAVQAVQLVARLQFLLRNHAVRTHKVFLAACRTPPPMPTGSRCICWISVANTRLSFDC